MQAFLLIAQIVLSIIIVAFVLLQSQGTGLGAVWGGGGETYHTRRGVERVIFVLTVAAIMLFALVSILVIA
ncbi:MAG: Preprotein translocase, SecG subunit [Candidatus Pacebacteria bacterium GW2011_GWB1_47_8]|nr:MAG: Preprotein translocase, SecG subunit [Candidatus Pacebacteria bacterium GW2011_GWA1_46_10]KKU84192.1 MAG: Preprotein translocase, SecG subunit [Candidatus Pacebacteria bacterium GW2011_GWB1_47_8]HCR81359.1 preprotein translocase subunit SecG [Candidatus Paceibacterota bacterium]